MTLFWVTVKCLKRRWIRVRTPWVIHSPRILVNQNRTCFVNEFFQVLFRVDHTQGHCLLFQGLENWRSFEYSILVSHSCPRIIAKLFSEHNRWQAPVKTKWAEKWQKKSQSFLLKKFTIFLVKSQWYTPKEGETIVFSRFFSTKKNSSFFLVKSKW